MIIQFIISELIKSAIGENRSISALTPKRKKLWFLFSNEPNPVLDFYCPRKHFHTNTEDLCYFFHRYQKMHKSAEQICKNSSQRVAEIESEATLYSLLYALEKFQRYLYSITEDAPSSSAMVAKPSIMTASTIFRFRFHVGAVFKKAQNDADQSNPRSHRLYWNESGLELNANLMCNLTQKHQNVTTRLECIELVVGNDFSVYKANVSHRSCLKPVDCMGVRYVVCEWRGSNTIQSYSKELEAQMINSYLLTLVVVVLFIFILSIIYLENRKRIQSEISNALENYKKELELFDFSKNSDED